MTKSEKAMAAINHLHTCEHESFFSFPRGECAGEVYLCVSCGAHRFEDASGKKGRWRHAPRVQAIRNVLLGR